MALAGTVYSRRPSNKVFLTLVGGGVFGNPGRWVFAAIERALTLYRDHPLDVSIVSYGQSNDDAADLAARFA